MRLTERLNVEHGVFLRQLRYLRELIRLGEPHAALVATVRTIATALADHDELEDRVLYPLLSRTFGADYPPLIAATEQHRRIAHALGRVTAGRFDQAELEAFIDLLNDHMEEEIHRLFPLADDWIPAETLASLNNWQVEHVTQRARGEAALEPSIG